jgi:hypothetical protein
MSRLLDVVQISLNDSKVVKLGQGILTQGRAFLRPYDDETNIPILVLMMWGRNCVNS